MWKIVNMERDSATGFVNTVAIPVCDGDKAIGCLALKVADCPCKCSHF